MYQFYSGRRVFDYFTCLCIELSKHSFEFPVTLYFEIYGSGAKKFHALEDEVEMPDSPDEGGFIFSSKKVPIL